MSFDSQNLQKKGQSVDAKHKRPISLVNYFRTLPNGWPQDT